MRGNYSTDGCCTPSRCVGFDTNTPAGTHVGGGESSVPLRVIGYPGLPEFRAVPEIGGFNSSLCEFPPTNPVRFNSVRPGGSSAALCGGSTQAAAVVLDLLKGR
jgi:hypothetical protein